MLVITAIIQNVRPSLADEKTCNYLRKSIKTLRNDQQQQLVFSRPISLPREAALDFNNIRHYVVLTQIARSWFCFSVS